MKKIIEVLETFFFEMVLPWAFLILAFTCGIFHKKTKENFGKGVK
jgi:hypothetical protein